MRILHYRPNASHPGHGTDSLGRIVDNLMWGQKKLGHDIFFYNEDVGTDWNLMSNICQRAHVFNPEEYDIVNFHTDIEDPSVDFRKKKFVRTLHWAIVEPWTTQEMQENLYTTVGISRYAMQHNDLWQQGQQLFVHNTIMLSDEDKVSIFNNVEEKEDYYIWIGGTDWFQQKGLDAAVRIAKFLNLNLRIYGSGKLKEPIDFIKDNLSDRITYHGLIEDDHEKYKVMAKSQGLLYPTLIADGGPTVVIEAQCCGCPVFAYDHSSFPELVLTDTLSPMHHYQQFMRNIAKARLRIEDFRDLAMRAQTMFSPLEAAKKYIQIYENILKYA